MYMVLENIMDLMISFMLVRQVRNRFGFMHLISEQALQIQWLEMQRLILQKMMKSQRLKI